MTNETKTGAELSQNESRNSTLKSQLNEWAPPVGSGPATQLTDAEWLNSESLAKKLQAVIWPHGDWPWETLAEQTKREWIKIAKTVNAELTTKYGNPSRIADLERQLAFRTEQVRTLEVANDEMERQLAEARKDTERLDWLDVQMEDVEKNGMLICQAWGVYGTTDDIRQAIDSEMKEGECNGSGEPAQENNNE